jgi:SAM-dependent methyltransferase
MFTELIPPQADPQAPAQFIALLTAALEGHTFVRLVLSKHEGAPADLQKLSAKRVELGGQAQLSFVYRHATRDITKNHPLVEGIAIVRGLLGPAFKHAHLHTLTEEVQLRFSKKGKSTLLRGKAVPNATAGDDANADAKAAPAPHNREKQRVVDLSRPFLAALGVADARGQLVPAMARKWRQINKFVEVFSHAYAASPLAQQHTPVRVLDFGSGKGYLTFAVHDHLRGTLGREAQVTGVELREDMVRLGNEAAATLALDGMHFALGDVRQHTGGDTDVMIALHACDMATDHAIHHGIRANAAIIMCSPCCHKQLRPQMQSPPLLRPMLQHGIHLGQQAEMVTDSLRALLLDATGYDTQVFEFVALEHTSKNKMILAVKRAGATGIASPEVLRQVQEIKAFYGVREHCLETLLQADGPAAAASA